MRKLLIAGNWKMHNTISETEAFFSNFLSLYSDNQNVDVAFAPPFMSIPKALKAVKGRPILIGAQNVHYEDTGAFTGEVSFPMLNEHNIDFVILGHSERRHVFGESNSLIEKKLSKSLKEEITPILCIGEKLEDRENEKTEKILQEQIDSAFNNLDASQAEQVIIAYEPVWAIGTGKTATPQIAEDAHIFIRKRIKELYNSIVADKIRILYGGSVKPENVRELMAKDNIDGALVGGASLKPDVFSKLIINCLED